MIPDDLSYEQKLYDAVEVAVVQAGYSDYLITIDDVPHMYRRVFVDIRLSWLRRRWFYGPALTIRIREMLCAVEGLNPFVRVQVRAVPKR